MANTDWIQALKVVDLKDELKKRGQPVSGKKAELVERLEAYVKENEADGGTSREPSPGDADEEEEEVASEEEKDGGAADVDGADQVPAALEKGDAEEAGQPPAAGKEEPAHVTQEEKAAEGSNRLEAAAAEAASGAAAEEGALADHEMRHADVVQPHEEQKSDGRVEVEQAAVPEGGTTEGGQQEASQGQEQEAEVAAATEADRVELDYGESDQEEAAAAVAAEEEVKASGASRKRDREGPGGAGERGRGEGHPSSVDRPSKTLRRGSGQGAMAAEAGEKVDPDSVPPAQEPPTRALRIDNFVRPFTEGQVRSMLNGYGFVKALWMPSIKTHCYAVYEDKAQAEAARKGTWQLQWPATNPKRLAPRYVPLREAEAAIGKGSGNPEFRIARTEEDGEEAAVEEGGREEGVPALDKDLVERRRSREWNKERPPEVVPVGREPPPLDPAGAAEGRPALAADGVRDLREVLSSRRSLDRGSSRGVLDRVEVGRGGELPPPDRRMPPREPSPEPAPVLSLDDLFRKTETKPCIYWLPLTEEQAADRKRKQAEAAAAAAAARQGERAAQAAAGAPPIATSGPPANGPPAVPVHNDRRH